MLTLFADIAPDLSQIEGIMAEQLVSSEPRVQQLIADLGEFHGKMLRPSLLVLTARSMGAVTQQHLRLAAALELIHTATLIHDDMIDGGDTRRGITTPHVRFGTSTAILLGDFFYTRAFHLVADLGDPWMTRTITATTNVICEGELHQMCAQRDLAMTRKEYDRIIYAKTAVLCETACRLGAALGNDIERSAAAAFGRSCGIAFQIVDDCLDLTGDAQKVGKSLTSDIERGRLTLPFLHALQDCKPDQRAVLGQRLLSVRGPEDIHALRDEVIERGGVEASLREARQHVAHAREQLTALPAGPHRDVLHDLAGFIVDREF